MYARTRRIANSSPRREGRRRRYSRRVRPVAVRILHPTAAKLEPLERALDDARGRNARRLADAFEAEGAADVLIVTEARGGLAFGALLRTMGTTPSVAGRNHGLIVLGAGALPLARARDVRRFLEVAGSGERWALANNRYSADAIAIGRPAELAGVPDLTEDNALPRWLEEVAGFEVDDLQSRWRLAVDLDSPLDVLLTGATLDTSIDTAPVRDRLDRVRTVAADHRGELVVAGRTSAATLRWLERSTASRTRALIEERGLRASTTAAMATIDRPAAPRAPRSTLGLLLDDRGPGALGAILGELADGALVDTRVLFAHRLGRDERAWPAAEDRFASDLLLAGRIRDPWLRALTESAREAPIPVLLGGHTLVGPGVRLALGRRR